MSMDGTDPATWDPARDGVLASPENPTVLYEGDVIRVVSVTVAPGRIEQRHLHRFPSIFVIDRTVAPRDVNGATGEEIPLPPISGLLLKHRLAWHAQYYGALGVVMAFFFWIMLPAGLLVLAAAFAPALAHRRDLREQRRTATAAA
jgi:hypothetical protein